MDNAHPLDRYAPYALAALRIVAALIFMAHGTQDPINNGAISSSITVAAHDAAILIRPLAE